MSNLINAKLSELQSIVKQLRAPDGCSWDKKQTLSTLAPHTIEEAYEVENAIAANDMQNLKEELGDLLLQIVFYSEISAELNLFELSDILESAICKMKRRHPHIFEKDSPLARLDWESIKGFEKVIKKTNNLPIKENVSSTSDPWELMVSDIPDALPSLSRSAKINNIAQRAGCGEADSNKLDKLKSNFEKLMSYSANSNNDVQSVNDNDKALLSTEQLSGEFLFLCVDYLRRLGIDAETALRKTNRLHEEKIKINPKPK